jgi:hypothetical protein
MCSHTWGQRSATINLEPPLHAHSECEARDRRTPHVSLGVPEPPSGSTLKLLWAMNRWSVDRGIPSRRAASERSGIGFGFNPQSGSRTPAVVRDLAERETAGGGTLKPILRPFPKRKQPPVSEKTTAARSQLS